MSDKFPRISFKEWCHAAQPGEKDPCSALKNLSQQTYDGTEIQPLYTRENAHYPAERSPLLSSHPLSYGSSQGAEVADASNPRGWNIRAVILTSDPAEAADHIREHLNNGADSVLLRFNINNAEQGSSESPLNQHSLPVNSANGIMSSEADTPLAIEAGTAFMPAAAALLSARKPGSTIFTSLGADPLGALAEEGENYPAAELLMKLMSDLAIHVSQNHKNVIPVRVSTAAYHNAGCSSAQETAFAAATGLEYLRHMERSGVSPVQAAELIEFSLQTGNRFFEDAAKLRAVRLLWKRIISACSNSGNEGKLPDMLLHAQVALRDMSRRDHRVNMLRNTAGCFAASIGGADIITTLPYDLLLRMPDSISRRIARNTQLVLREETALHRVMDPAGGSYFLESLTEDIIASAVNILQQIEESGGMLNVLRTGMIHEMITEVRGERRENISRRKDPITGVSEFPDPKEVLAENNISPETGKNTSETLTTVQQKALDEAEHIMLESLKRKRWSGEVTQEVIACTKAGITAETIMEMIKSVSIKSDRSDTNIKLIAKLPVFRSAEIFEKLRDAADNHFRETGDYPQVFLVAMGPVSEHAARVRFAENFFTAGGFRCVSSTPCMNAADLKKQLQGIGYKIAALCGSDTSYKEHVREYTEVLQQSGTAETILTGKPGEEITEYQEDGINMFIYKRCNTEKILTSLLRKSGVKL